MINQLLLVYMTSEATYDWCTTVVYVRLRPSCAWLHERGEVKKQTNAQKQKREGDSTVSYNFDISFFSAVRNKLPSHYRYPITHE